MASASELEILFKTRGLDQVSRDTGDIGKDFEKMGDTAGRSFKGMEVSAVATGAAIGVAITGGISVALGAIGKIGGALMGAIDSAGDFQSQMAQVNTLGADFGMPFEQVEADVSDLAKTMGIDAVDAATALYNAVSAGVPPDNALTFLEQAGKAAIGGAADLDAVGAAMSVVMNSWGSAAGDAEAVTDKLFATIGAGVTTMPELAANIGNVAATAAAANVTWDESAAALAALTLGGKNTAQASTMLNTMFAEIINPASKATKVLTEHGFATGAAAIKSEGLAGVLAILEKEAAKSGLSVNAMFGGVEAGQAALLLAGDNAERYADVLKKVGSAAGLTDEAYAKMNETWNRQKELLSGQIEGVLREIGMALLPSLSEALGHVTDALSKVDWEPITAAVSEFGAAIAEKIANIDWEGMVGQVQGFIDSLKDFDWQKFAEDIEGALGFIIDLVRAIGSLADAVSALPGIGSGEKAEKMSGKSADELMQPENWGQGVRETNLAVDMAKGLPREALETFAAVANEKLSDAGLSFEDFRETANSALEGVREGLDEAEEHNYDFGDTIKSIFSEVDENIGGALSGAMEKVDGFVADASTAWADLKSNVTDRVNEIGERVQGAWESMRVGVSGIQGGMSEWISTTWDTLRERLSTTTDGIRDRLTTAWSNVANSSSETWTWIYNAVMTRATALVNGIRGALTWVWERVKAVWEAVANATQRAWDWIREKVNWALSAVTGAIKSAFHWIYDRVIKPVWQKITAAIGTAWAWIKRKTYETLAPIYEAVVGAFKGLVGAIGPTMKAVAGVVGEGFGKVMDIIRAFVNAVKSIPIVGDILSGADVRQLERSTDDAAARIDAAMAGLSDVPDNAADILGSNFERYNRELEAGIENMPDIPEPEAWVPPAVGGGGGGGGQGPFEIGGLYSDNMGDYTFNELGEKVYTSGVGLARQNAKAAEQAEKAARSAVSSGRDGLARGTAEGLREKTAADMAGMFAAATTAGLEAIALLMSKALPDMERIKERMGTVEAFFIEVGQAVVRATDAIGVEALIAAEGAIGQLGVAMDLMTAGVRAMAGFADVEAVAADKIKLAETFMEEVGKAAARLASGVDTAQEEQLRKAADVLSSWLSAISGAAGTMAAIANIVLPKNTEEVLARITALMDAVALYADKIVTSALEKTPEIGDLLDVMDASQAIADVFVSWAGSISAVAAASTALAESTVVAKDALKPLEEVMDSIYAMIDKFTSDAEAKTPDAGDRTARFGLMQIIAQTFQTWALALTEMVQLSTVAEKMKAIAPTVWADMEAALTEIARIIRGFIAGEGWDLTRDVEGATENQNLMREVIATLAKGGELFAVMADLTGKLTAVADIPPGAFGKIETVLSEIARITRSLVTGEGWDLTDSIPAETVVQKFLREVISTYTVATALVSDVVDLMVKLEKPPVVAEGAIKTVGENLGKMFDAVKLVADEFIQRGMTDEGAADNALIIAGLKAYIDGAGAAVKLLVDAAGINVKWEKVTAVTADQLRVVGGNITLMLAEVATIAAEFIMRGMDDEGAKTNSAIAAGLKTFVDMAKSAVDLLASAGGLTVRWDKVSGDIAEGVGRARKNVELILGEVTAMATGFIMRGMTDEGAELNAAIVAGFNAFVDMAKGALDVMTAGATFMVDLDKMTELTAALLAPVVANVKVIVAEADKLKDELLALYGMDELTEIADVMDLVISPVQALADASVALSSLQKDVRVSADQVQVILEGIKVIFDAITGPGGILSTLDEEATKARVELVIAGGNAAEAMGKVGAFFAQFIENPFFVDPRQSSGFRAADRNYIESPGGLKDQMVAAIRNMVEVLVGALNDQAVQDALNSVDETLTDNLDILGEAYGKVADVLNKLQGVTVPGNIPAIMQAIRDMATAFGWTMPGAKTTGGGGGGASTLGGVGDSGGTGGSGTLVVNLTNNVQLGPQTLETLFSQLTAPLSRHMTFDMPGA